MNFTPRTTLGDFLSSQWATYAVNRTGVNFPNCFTYATARISEIVGYNQSLDPENQKVNGAQDLWNTHHSNFTQSSTPKAGALMIWRYGTWGHVAVCENDSGTAWSQSNYGGSTFEYIIGNPNGYCGMQFLGYLVHKDLNGDTSSSLKFEDMTEEYWAVRFINETPIIIHKDKTDGQSFGTFVAGETQVYTRKGVCNGHRWIGWSQDINGVTYNFVCAISGSEVRGQDMWCELIDPATLETGNMETPKTEQVTAPDYLQNVKMYGCDISRHNDGLDISNEGFVIIRAAYGTNEDASFLDNVKKCKTANIPFGVYLYSYAIDNEGAQSEADFIINLLQTNEIVPDMGVWYDMEDADSYKMKNNALTPDNCTTFTQIFCDALNKAGYYVGYYTSSSWVGTMVNRVNYPLWVANWGSNDGNLNGDFSDQAVMLQYTSKPYDKNVLYIDRSEMKSTPKKQTTTDNNNNGSVTVGTVKLDEESIELLRENVELLKRLSTIIKF